MKVPASIDLPPPTAEPVDVKVEGDALRALRAAAEAEGAAPEDDEQLVRYLVYLGAAYLRADRIAAEPPDQTFDRLFRLAGEARGAASVLRFHSGEAAREHAGEARAVVAAELVVVSLLPAVERLEEETRRRRERVRILREALDAA